MDWAYCRLPGLSNQLRWVNFRMVDLTNPTVATLIGVLVGFLLSFIPESMKRREENKRRRRSAYMLLDGILKRSEAHAGSRTERQLTEEWLRELENTMSLYSDALDKSTLKLWFSVKPKVVMQGVYQADLGTLTDDVRDQLKKLS